MYKPHLFPQNLTLSVLTFQLTLLPAVLHFFHSLLNQYLNIFNYNFHKSCA